MTDLQFWAIVAFAAILLAVVRLMRPAPRKLDGRQKYRRERIPGRDADPDANKRPSMSPMAAALAAWFGSSMGAGAANEGVAGQSGDHGGGDGADGASGE